MKNKILKDIVVMELSRFSMIFVLTVSFFNLGDDVAGAEIASWNRPSDITGASGTSSELITVAQDAGLGTQVFHFDATATESHTINQYDMITKDSPFGVAFLGGQLNLWGKLDYKTKKSYILEVRATDNAGNTGTATVTITVTVPNEATPEFEKTSYTICVVDCAAPDTSVTTFSATDADTDSVITYSIDTGNTNEDFKVLEAELQVAKTLDKGKTPTYTLAVHATDNGIPQKTGTSTYIINVESSCQNGAVKSSCQNEAAESSSQSGTTESSGKSGVTKLTMKYVTLFLTLVLSFN